MKPNEQTRAFLKSLSRQRLSANTMKAYENAIMRYYRYFDRLSTTNLLRYQALLTAQYRPQSANLSIIGINKYLTFLGKLDWRLPVQRIQHCGFLENVITLGEYQQMLDFTSRICATKDYCIIRTLALTGARVSELKQFRIEHIRQGYLDIVSKGNKRPLKHMTCSWTQRYEATDGFLAKPQNQISLIVQRALAAKTSTSFSLTVLLPSPAFTTRNNPSSPV